MSTPEIPRPDSAAARSGALIDPERLMALTDLGLSRRSDPSMERYAARVRDALDVPVSLVSLVQADEQVFPGMCGLPDPWATSRSTPLSHSFCQHVVTSGAPLVIDDARNDPLVATNLATTEIGVIAYVGVPLTDDHGHVLGSLCAIQRTPRAWTPADLAVLADIATDCSNDIRLRLARLDAEREGQRRDAIDARLRQQLDWSQRLLTIAEALNTCRTVEDVRRQLASFTDPRNGLIGVVLHVTAESDAASVEVLDRLLARRTMAIISDLRVRHEVLDDARRSQRLARSARAATYLRLQGSAAPLGVVEMLWDVARDLEPPERATAAALAAYTAQALERALLFEDRI